MMTFSFFITNFKYCNGFFTCLPCPVSAAVFV
jgi:hypothetical protein